MNYRGQRTVKEFHHSTTRSPGKIPVSCPTGLSLFDSSQIYRLSVSSLLFDMGVPKFYRWISERYPCLSQVIKEYQVC